MASSPRGRASGRHGAGGPGGRLRAVSGCSSVRPVDPRYALAARRRRRSPSQARHFAVLALVALLACAPQTSPDVRESTHGAGAADDLPERRPVHGEVDAFSPERAWVNLEAIASRDPRTLDSAAAEATRTYLRNRLLASGLQLAELEFELALPEPAPAGSAGEGGQGGPLVVRKRNVTSLLARLKGDSDDLLLVAAPYTSPEIDGRALGGSNAGGSGAAVALELARALAEGDRRYSYLFAFIAGDGVDADPAAGSRALAAELERRRILERVRAGMFLDRVGRAELRIARDLQSSGPYRDLVWETARDAGHGDAFADDGFASPDGGHSALRDAGLRQLVALIEPPGVDAPPAAAGIADCSPESLAVVGDVALDSLRRIEDRLARLDHYGAAPADATRRSERDREAAAVDAHAPDPSPAASESAR